jgi:hypothetical protein
VLTVVDVVEELAVASFQSVHVGNRPVTDTLLVFFGSDGPQFVEEDPTEELELEKALSPLPFP